MLIRELIEEGKRRQDLKYTEKKVKDKLDKVIVDLKGNESAKFTRLGKQYAEVKSEMDALEAIREVLNDEIKAEALELFNATDEVLTRVVETVSLTVQLSKKTVIRKTTVDYEAIITDISKLVPELQEQITKIVNSYTEITNTEKSPALTVKVNEGIINDIAAFAKKVLNGIVKWCTGYDRRLAKIKKAIEVL